MLSDHEFWGLYVPCMWSHGHNSLPVSKTVELGNTSFGSGFGLPWMTKTRYSTLTQDLFRPISKVFHPELQREVSIPEHKIGTPLAYWYMKTEKEYLSIDINGHHNSLNHDLQKEITNECPINYYEILLDFGTIEHVKNQYIPWKNCHNLVKKGGIMIHSLPAVKKGSWVEHGYHWYTIKFFEELAVKCGYEVRLLDEVKVPNTESDYQIWVCLRKNNFRKFISESEFLEIMKRHVYSEYNEKSNGKSRHGIPPDINIKELGDV